jgi:hypothetical protein
MDSRILCAQFSLACLLAVGLCPAQGAPEEAPAESVPKGWVRYVNTADHYVLWHPSDWRPRVLDNGALHGFALTGGGEHGFSVSRAREPEGGSLEQLFQRWKADLERAEGGQYLLELVREVRLGSSRALEIPMTPGASGYETRLWLVDLGGPKYAVLARVDEADDTVRTILATMRAHAEPDASHRY